MFSRKCHAFALTLALCLPSFAATPRALLDQYCTACHTDKLHTGGVSVEHLNVDQIGESAETWEKVLRKLSTGEMPPPGVPHPDEDARKTVVSWLENSLDRAAAAKPNPGRPTIHRLNRAEYGNAVRDLLALNYDASAMLPTDDSGYGFDNIGDVLSVSPVLLERYMSAARKVSRLAVGDPHVLPAVEQYPVSRGMAQMDQVSEDLPLGSRGGIAIHHYFPLDAVYTFRVNMRPAPGGASSDEPHFDVRVPVKAGPRIVGVTFMKESAMRKAIAPPPGPRAQAPAMLTPQDPLPSELDVRVDDVRVKLIDVPWSNPAVSSVWIGGPYEVQSAGDTPSRERIFICNNDSEACATKILSALARRAYRRPVNAADIQPLLNFYRSGHKSGNFESGIELALRAILVSPDFLFRIERDPAASAAGNPHRVSDLELASRLSFFLWSSIPDDELLNVAEQGKLHEASALQQQVRRMLADDRSKALVNNFAGQWLYLRNLDKITPDPDAFPEFDDGLRKSFQHETELFLDAVLREDRSVVDLLDSNFTFVNERLARFYGIPNVHGPAFRRVTLADGNRGGLLGQGRLLTVTSYPNRTSVVQRGKWILENVLGTPR